MTGVKSDTSPLEPLLTIFELLRASSIQYFNSNSLFVELNLLR